MSCVHITESSYRNFSPKQVNYLELFSHLNTEVVQKIVQRVMKSVFFCSGYLHKHFTGFLLEMLSPSWKCEGMGLGERVYRVPKRQYLMLKSQHGKHCDVMTTHHKCVITKKTAKKSLCMCVVLLFIVY